MTPLVEAAWADARVVASRLGRPLGIERVPVEASTGRVLADGVVAACDLPYYDTSAMDGWAVAGAGPWRVVGDVAAGRPWGSSVLGGTAVRIATGGVVPTGVDAVIPWERAEVVADLVYGEAEQGRHIRRAGEECRRGELIAGSGTDVSPALAGFLAATGHDDVAVAVRPRIGLLLLGDELQARGIPSDGRVRDSLGPQLPGWIARMGAQASRLGEVPDLLHDVVAALDDAAPSCDVIVTTGGTAAGPRDHLHAAVAGASGRVLVDRVAVRPGHPMLLATIRRGGRDVPVVGLPGNPHSAVVGMVTFLMPLVDAMLGRPETDLPRFPAEEELRGPSGSTRLVAGNVIEGVFRLSPYGGSAMLRGLAQSSGFAIVPPGGVPEGTPVEWLALP